MKMLDLMQATHTELMQTTHTEHIDISMYCMPKLLSDYSFRLRYLKYDTFSFTVWLGVHQSENCPV